MSISCFGYCTIVRQDVTIGAKLGEGYVDLLYNSFGNLLGIYSYSKVKRYKKKLEVFLPWRLAISLGKLPTNLYVHLLSILNIMLLLFPH